ncbi:hypothetical protein [Halomonas sp. B23F22_10]|uniref:hypothetical protein n=1 Tax=Halomonas sp. B23F22_10 TaxID=3459515 RepID=UPI00373EC3E9
MSDDALFFILFGPILLWWAWDQYKWEKTLKRWHQEDQETRARIRRRRDAA